MKATGTHLGRVWAGLAIALAATAAGAQTGPTLTLRQLALSFAPRADAGSGWGVGTVQTGATTSDVITGSAPGGGEMRFMVALAQPRISCRTVMEQFSRGDTTLRHTRTHFLPIAGWYGEALLAQQGIYVVCRDGTPRALVATMQGVTGRPDEAVAIRGVLEPLGEAVAAMQAAAAPLPAAAPASSMPAAPAGATVPAAAPAAAARPTLQTVMPNATGSLPGGRNAWSWAPVESSDAVTLMRRTPPEPPLALVVHPIGREQPCAQTLVDWSGRFPGATREAASAYLPVYFHPEALRLPDGSAAACLPPVGMQTLVVQISADTAADAKAVQAVLSQLAYNLRQALPMRGPTIDVNLSRNRLGFQIPGSVGWVWRAQPADLGGDPGAVLVGRLGENYKLEIGIRAIPSQKYANGCLDLAPALGMAYRNPPFYVPQGYSQYYSKRSESSIAVCLVRRGTYFSVILNGNLQHYDVQTEALNILTLLQAAAR